MALFGRRKPGFSKEVEMKPSEIPGEFSDALDPAVNKELDNPKVEKKEMQEAAAQAMAGEQPEKKPDIFDYMQSLPDVEDPFKPSEPEPEQPPEPVKTKAQLLAYFIRTRSKSALITRMVEIRALVTKLGNVRQDQESVGKSFTDIELLMILFRQFHSVPLSVSTAALAKVDCHVKNNAPDHTYQFSLGMFLLKMKSAQDTLHGR